MATILLSKHCSHVEFIRLFSAVSCVGYWEENVTVEECRVTQRVYAHQYYTRLLVTEIFAQRQGTAKGVCYINTNVMM